MVSTILELFQNGFTNYGKISTKSGALTFLCPLDHISCQIYDLLKSEVVVSHHIEKLKNCNYPYPENVLKTVLSAVRVCWMTGFWTSWNINNKLCKNDSFDSKPIVFI